MLNEPVPDFEVPATGGTSFRLSDRLGKPLIIYFYPKDNTPGCTSEGLQFSEFYPQFSELGYEIYGVSRDSIKSHENFKAKMNFPFALLSDADEIACKLFGVIKMKNIYGKKVRGIERSTFVINAAGILRRDWRGVKVPGHAAEVYEFAKTSAD